MNPKTFLKAPLAPTYTNFEGERAPEKCKLLVNIFQKVLKNVFLANFFTRLLAAQKTRPKQGFFSALGELEKSIWSTKKESTEFLKIFENSLPSPPLLEKILDPALVSELFQFI